MKRVVRHEARGTRREGRVRIPCFFCFLHPYILTFLPSRASCLVPLACLLFLLSSPAHAQQTMSAQQRVILQNIQTYLNSIKTLQADIDDSSQGGAIRRTGKLYIVRPLKIRVDYTNPVEQVIGNGDSVMHYNAELDQITYLSLSDLPFLSFLGETINLFDPKLDVRLATQDDKVAVRVVDRTRKADDPANKPINLVFQSKPLQLLYWYVDLPNNQQLYTTLTNVKMNEEMPQGLFTFKSPRFNKGSGAPTPR